MVIIDEVYRTKRAVFPDFTDNPTNTVAVIVVVLDGKTDAVVASGKQFAVRGGKPSYSLVHHCLQVVGRWEISTFVHPSGTLYSGNSSTGSLHI